MGGSYTSGPDCVMVDGNDSVTLDDINEPTNWLLSAEFYEIAYATTASRAFVNLD